MDFPLDLKEQVVGREKQNIQLLAILCLLIPIIWMVFLDWSFDELIDQHDNLATGYIYKKQFIEVDGDWEKLLYWPQIMGGVKAHDITGSLPVVYRNRDFILPTGKSID